MYWVYMGFELITFDRKFYPRFFPNVNPILRQHLCGILGVFSNPSIGKYLGFPLTLLGLMGIVLGILISLWREFKLSFSVGKQSFFLLQVGWFLSNLLPPLFRLITCRMLP